MMGELEPKKPEQKQAISRRRMAAKLAYIPPAIYAVISADQRPILAASTGKDDHPSPGHGPSAPTF